MFDDHVKTTFGVSQGGAAALSALQRTMTGRIGALFDRSFYIDLGEDWVCMGSETLPMGPLNIQSSAPTGTHWPSSGVRMDDRVLIVGDTAHVAQSLVFSLSGAIAWKAAPPIGWTVSRLALGLNRLDKLLPYYDAVDGLACFARCTPVRNPVNPTAAAGRDAIALLSTALEHDEFRTVVIADAAKRLIGLGPGLTPSGDDFLGGMMIALQAIGRETAATALWTAVAPHLTKRTTAISGAHLRAAAGGTGHEALHTILNDLLRGESDSMRDHLDRIDAIGHCSGWDALAGVLIILRSMVEPRS